MITALSILRLIPKKYYKAIIVQNGKIVADGLIEQIMANNDLNLGEAVTEIYPITNTTLEIVLE